MTINLTSLVHSNCPCFITILISPELSESLPEEDHIAHFELLDLQGQDHLAIEL